MNEDNKFAVQSAIAFGALVMVALAVLLSLLNSNETRAVECRAAGRSWHDRGWGNSGECWDR